MGVFISGWSAISPLGIGRDPLAGQLSAWAPKLLESIDGLRTEGFPAAAAYCIQEFDLAAIIGRRRGLRLLDRTTAIAVATAYLALEDAAKGGTIPVGDDIGVVVGTANGSTRSLLQFLQESYVAEQPHQVSPEKFPLTVMNFAAGQIAALFGLTGLNATIAGGRLAALLALQYAVRVIRRGYCRAVVAGSAQEFSPEDAWRTANLAALHGDPVSALGEGGAMFLLSGRAEGQRPPIAEILACKQAVALSTEPDQLAACLVRCIQCAMREANVTPQETCTVSKSSDAGGPFHEAESRALRQVFGDDQRHRSYCVAQLGETHCASFALELAALLAAIERQEVPENACVLLPAMSFTRSVGCLLIRRLSVCD